MGLYKAGPVNTVTDVGAAPGFATALEVGWKRESFLLVIKTLLSLPVPVDSSAHTCPHGWPWVVLLYNKTKPKTKDTKVRGSLLRRKREEKGKRGQEGDQRGCRNESNQNVLYTYMKLPSNKFNKEKQTNESNITVK